MESLASMVTRSSCFLFVIFFLCFFVHACSARNIRLRNAGSAREFLSCKIGKKARSTMDSFQPAEADLIGYGQTNKLCWKPKKIKGLLEETEYVSGRSSVVIPFRFTSLERSIPWHVPRKKHDKHPGFYSDYSRPRIRPPSHN